MKRKISMVVFIAGLSLLWGCYPDGPDYVEDMDVVMTYHNPDYNFAARATYAMPDKIVKITGNTDQNQDPVFIPDGTAEKILARIESNMESLGWERVNISDTANIDLLLLPASWETTTVYFYDYWGWWYGGYYPYYGYPSYYMYSSYTTGTLLMGLVDPKEVSSNGNPVNQWTGAINGIMTDYYDATRINTAIDKAFDQSPYLKTN